MTFDCRVVISVRGVSTAQTRAALDSRARVRRAHAPKLASLTRVAAEHAGRRRVPCCADLRLSAGALDDARASFGRTEACRRREGGANMSAEAPETRVKRSILAPSEISIFEVSAGRAPGIASKETTGQRLKREQSKSVRKRGRSGLKNPGTDLLSIGVGGSDFKRAQLSEAERYGLLPADKSSKGRPSLRPERKTPLTTGRLGLFTRKKEAARSMQSADIASSVVEPSEVIDLEVQEAPMASGRSRDSDDDNTRPVSDSESEDPGDVTEEGGKEESARDGLSFGSGSVQMTKFQRMRRREKPLPQQLQGSSSRIHPSARIPPPQAEPASRRVVSGISEPLRDVKNTKLSSVPFNRFANRHKPVKKIDKASVRPSGRIPAEKFYGHDKGAKSSPRPQGRGLVLSAGRRLLLSSSRSSPEEAVRVASSGSDKERQSSAQGAKEASSSPVSVQNMLRPVANKRLRPLSPEERTRFQTATQNVTKGEVVAEVKSANIRLRGKDIVRLRGRRWLNDEVVNAMVGLVNERNRQHFAGASAPSNLVRNDIDGCDETNATGKAVNEKDADDECQLIDRNVVKPGRPRSYMFSSFFFTRLAGNGYDYEGVRRWPLRAKIDVASLDLILFPVNLNNFHWVLAAIDMKHKEFLYLDSMYGADSFNVLPTLRRWLYDEVKNKHGEEEANALKIRFWTDVEKPSYLPEQKDDGSCGVFTLYMADYLELGKTPDFDQDDIAVLRQRAVLFLKDGALPST